MKHGEPIAVPLTIMGVHAISTTDISRRFDHIQAVDKISLAVPAGSVYGFLGPNGSGKTTTVRMLLGLIKPSGGTIQLFDQPINGHGRRILSRVGSMVENPSLYAHLTGRENLEIDRTLRGVDRSEIDRVLQIVGLARDADRPTKQYSLGMKQRLGLALALLGQPDLLILDEPTNGLDPAGIREMRELIRDLPKQTGLTVFLSSHLLGEVQQIATHVGIVNKGKLLFQGSLEDLQKAQKPSVEIDAVPVEFAHRVLTDAGWAAASHDNGTLTVTVQQPQESATLNKLLVESGIDVHQVRRTEHSLEALFLQMTDNKAGDRT